MKLPEVMNELQLKAITKEPIRGDVNVESAYACDLLSQVLASAKRNSIWITVQSHLNIIGVAAMTGIAAIIICDEHAVPGNVVEKADEERIVLIQSNENAFQLSGKLYGLGIR